MKPANTLVLMDEHSATKYHPILTDLGGAVDISDPKLKKYPRVDTPRYFSFKLKDISTGRELTIGEIVASEIFTLGRTIQELVWIGLDAEILNRRISNSILQKMISNLREIFLHF